MSASTRSDIAGHLVGCLRSHRECPSTCFSLPRSPPRGAEQSGCQEMPRCDIRGATSWPAATFGRLRTMSLRRHRTCKNRREKNPLRRGATAHTESKLAGLREAAAPARRENGHWSRLEAPRPAVGVAWGDGIGWGGLEWCGGGLSKKKVSCHYFAHLKADPTVKLKEKTHGPPKKN